jgi:hypothetical protein
VVSVDGVAAAEARPETLAVRINAKPGDEVRALRDNWDRLGFAAVVGADADAAIAAGTRLVDEVIDIRVEDADGGVTRATVAEIPTAVTV